MPRMPDAIILCGGAGLRLRSVTDGAPKALAAIAGRPFLELPLRQLRRNGFERAILAVGHKREVIRSHFGRQAFGLSLEYAIEESPLGTGGAVRNAVDLVRSEAVVILNGDSYTDVDLCKLVGAHGESGADLTVVVAETDGRTDCGSVVINQDGQLTSFEEKQSAMRASYLNAGIYMASRHLLSEVPSGTEISLERELVPAWLQQGRCVRAFVSENSCIDIGTPERYITAQEVLASAESDLISFQVENQ